MTEHLVIESHAKLGRTDPENCEREGVRAFKSSPYRVSLQVRSRTDKVGYYSTAELTADQCRELSAFFDKAADLLVDEDAQTGFTHDRHVGRSA